MIGRRLAWALLILAALTALSPLALSAMRQAPGQHDQRLALDFPHEKHIVMRCVDCHHADTGVLPKTTPCVACHRDPRAGVKIAVEPRFHAFCRDCHAERARARLPHGPVRDCGACHRHPQLQ